MSVFDLVDASVPAHAPEPKPGETPWLRGDVRPVQIGVYKRLALGRKVMFSFFDGERWFKLGGTPDEAARTVEPSLVQNLPWLGLSVQPAQGYGPQGSAS